MSCKQERECVKTEGHGVWPAWCETHNKPWIDCPHAPITPAPQEREDDVVDWAVRRAAAMRPFVKDAGDYLRERNTPTASLGDEELIERVRTEMRVRCGDGPYDHCLDIFEAAVKSCPLGHVTASLGDEELIKDLLAGSDLLVPNPNSLIDRAATRLRALADENARLRERLENQEAWSEEWVKQCETISALRAINASLEQRIADLREHPRTHYPFRAWVKTSGARQDEENMHAKVLAEKDAALAQCRELLEFNVNTVGSLKDKLAEKDAEIARLDNALIENRGNMSRCMESRQDEENMHAKVLAEKNAEIARLKPPALSEELTHTRSCPSLTPRDGPCTCGLAERRDLSTRLRALAYERNTFARWNTYHCEQRDELLLECEALRATNASLEQRVKELEGDNTFFDTDPIPEAVRYMDELTKLRATNASLEQQLRELRSLVSYTSANNTLLRRAFSGTDKADAPHLLDIIAELRTALEAAYEALNAQGYNWLSSDLDQKIANALAAA